MADVSPQITELINYAVDRQLIEPEDRVWATNQVLEVLEIDTYSADSAARSIPEVGTSGGELHQILDALLDDASERGVLVQDSVVFRDLLDTAVMGRLTPPPRQVRHTFESLRRTSPREATNWFYQLCQDTNYIRRDRMKKDRAWKSATDAGVLDITINLAKPEKDPAAIAAARNMPASSYPKCLLCVENEGYAGRVNHPARQNHRIAPVVINNSPWFIQYSPYVYYNEHCIVLNAEHTPMRIERATFAKLLDFVAQFPHYFVGSNADLPIVGGSILAHDHFQGGNFEFAMERAPIEERVDFDDFPDVRAGIVDWPMSVIRLTSEDSERLIELADRILNRWRNYSDPDAFIFAETAGIPHNTITPIARRRGDDFELDLVLRNNITTEEHPSGLYHPHAELHHLKKENIGLIEVMGLAVLPARLKDELDALTLALVEGSDLSANELTEKHASWASTFISEVQEAIKDSSGSPVDVARAIVEQRVGEAFAEVLRHCGVYKQTPQGRADFLRFIRSV